VALKAMQSSIDSNNETALVGIAKNLNIAFKDSEIYLEDKDVSNTIREEKCGIKASEIATFPQVRNALTARQHIFRQHPGLITDGRDMGSVIFPDATLKVFLTASAKIRAQRRYNQLMKKEISANIEVLLQDIQARDTRDSHRSVAPLQQKIEAKMLDTTSLSITEATNKVLSWYIEICHSI
jgi:cytidylate kinase